LVSKLGLVGVNKAIFNQPL
jgi:hypothetical protein